MNPALFFGANNERTFALKPLFFRDQGRGELVVVLHGLGSSSDETFFARSDHWRSLHIDLPGFGHSKDPEETMEQVARRVLSVLDQVQVEKATWVGLSFGGHVSLKVAEIAPQRVKQLFLVSSGGLDPQPPAALAAAFNEELLAARSDAQVRLACEALSALKNDETRAFTERRLKEHKNGDYRAIALSALAALNDTVAQRLEAITVPTAIIHGTADPMIPVATAKAAAERLPQGQLTILDECAHMPWLEAPEKLHGLLHQFLMDSLMKDPRGSSFTVPTCPKK